jgi:hypothetical protein
MTEKKKLSMMIEKIICNAKAVRRVVMTVFLKEMK